jgi:hypothetical protein
VALVTGRLGPVFSGLQLSEPPQSAADQMDQQTGHGKHFTISRNIDSKNKRGTQFPSFHCCDAISDTVVSFSVELSGRGRFPLNKRFKRSTQILIPK